MGKLMEGAQPLANAGKLDELEKLVDQALEMLGETEKRARGGSSEASVTAIQIIGFKVQYESGCHQCGTNRNLACPPRGEGRGRGHSPLLNSSASAIDQALLPSARPSLRGGEGARDGPAVARPGSRCQPGSAEWTGRGSVAGASVGVKADDPAAGSAAVDDHGRGIRRLGCTVMAQAIDSLDPEVEFRREAGRDGPDVLARVFLAVHDRLPGRAGHVGPPEQRNGVGARCRSLARQAIATLPAFGPVPIWGRIKLHGGRRGIDLDPALGRIRRGPAADRQAPMPSGRPGKGRRFPLRPGRRQRETSGLRLRPGESRFGRHPG